ncbi:MAG TPA: hypothetical protein VHS80_10240, partial [Chthoniobacterales bacterium]|nr:hypothetical protein [Chthoniobacterales bacterium]
TDVLTTTHQSPITSHFSLLTILRCRRCRRYRRYRYSGLAIPEAALKQSRFYVNCGPKIRRQQCR